MNDLTRLCIRRLAFDVDALEQLSQDDVGNVTNHGGQLASFHGGQLEDANNPGKWVTSLAKIDLARDRDALGAALGVRALPAPHAALNGAHAALPIVHGLIAWRVDAM